jgi:nitrite reductase (NADH) small subunit
MGNFVRVAGTSDLGPGQCKSVAAGERELAIFNVDGTYYAIDNTCPHRGGPLGEGFVEGKIVTCPWHGWSYDVTTGICPVNTNVVVRTYPVKIEGADIQVEV